MLADSFPGITLSQTGKRNANLQIRFRFIKKSQYPSCNERWQQLNCTVANMTQWVALPIYHVQLIKMAKINEFTQAIKSTTLHSIRPSTRVKEIRLNTKVKVTPESGYNNPIMVAFVCWGKMLCMNTR